MISDDVLAVLRPPAVERPVPPGPVRVIGIDLGTTNSTVAELNWPPDGPGSLRARCVEVEQPTPEGTYIHLLVPSIVALCDGRTWVGEGAKRLRARAAQLGLRQDVTLFYDCKNDIGVRRTYHRAAEGFRTAADIGGHVLRFLRDAALVEDQTPIGRVVVTVPASFQAAQRLDTVAAAISQWLALRRLRRKEAPVLSGWTLSITLAFLLSLVGLAALWGVIAR